MDVGRVAITAQHSTSALNLVTSCVSVTVCSPRKLSVLVHEPFKANRELNITAPHHILDFELCKLCLYGTTNTHKGIRSNTSKKTKIG